MDFTNEATGFNIGVEDSPPMSGGWREIAGDRKVTKAAFIDFGLGDQCTAYLEFDDGTYEVGTGEVLRPYDRLYQGTDCDKARAAFMSKLLTLTNYN